MTQARDKAQGTELRARVQGIGRAHGRGLRARAAPTVGGSGLGCSGNQGSAAAQAQGSGHTGARQSSGHGAQGTGAGH